MQTTIHHRINHSARRFAGCTQDVLLISIIFVVLFTVYAYTAPRTIALEDDGLFVLASYYLGIAHPPGYPLHTLIGKLFTLLPFGSIAYRVHLMSGFFGALSCVFLYLSVRRLALSPVVALIVAFAFGFSPVFWSQAIIAEVYTLNACLFFLLLYLIIRIHPACVGRNGMSDRERFFQLLLIALIYGLSLANHWPLIGLSTPGLLILLWPLRTLIARNIIALLLVALIGLLPYLWLVVRSQMDPLISFYGPLTTWDQFWFMLSRKGYAAADASQTATLTDKIEYLLFFATETGRQFRFPGTLLVLIGFIAQWRLLPKSIASALCVIVLFNSILLILLLSFDYEYLQRYVFMVYPIIAYGIMAMWFGLGAWDIVTTLVRIKIKIQSKLKEQIVWASVAILTIMPVLYYGVKHYDRHAYDWSKHYAENILNYLPKDAVLFARGDVDFGTLAYFHLVEKIRPDITLMNPSGLVLNNRLFHPLRLNSVEYKEHVESFVKASQQPVHFTREKPAGFKYIHHWLYQTVSPDFATNRAVLTEEQINFFTEFILNSSETDPWTIFIINQLKMTFAAALAMSIERGDDYNQPRIMSLLEKFKTDYYASVGFVEGVFVNPKPHSIITVGEFLKSAQQHYPEMAQKSDKAKFYELLAYYNIEIGDKDAGIHYLNTSIDIWPSENNRAVKYLLNLFKDAHQDSEYKQLFDHIRWSTD